MSGVLKVQMDDGTEPECRPDDVSLIPARHDAWVVGDEPVVIVDFYVVMFAAAGKYPDECKGCFLHADRRGGYTPHSGH